MANHASAKKRIRQTARRSDVNNMRRTRIRSFIKKVESAIEGGDRSAATEALKVAQPYMMQGAGRGIFHKNTISRKLSRLSAQIKGMTA